MKGDSTDAANAQQQVLAKFQSMRQEQVLLAQKIAELEQENREHMLVLSTLEEIDPTRKCFRLVGGVLVERTVAEVRPALQSNMEQMQVVTKQLNEQLENKARRLVEFKEENNIRFVSDNDATDISRRSDVKDGSDKKEDDAATGKGGRSSGVLVE